MKTFVILVLLMLAAEGFAQGIYTQVKAVNIAGRHHFPASILTTMPALYEFVPKRGHPEGEVVTIRLAIGGTIIIDDVVIYRHGRTSRNLAQDTMMLTIDQLANAPLDLQIVLAGVERLPANQTGRTTVRGR